MAPKAPAKPAPALLPLEGDEPEVLLAVVRQVSPNSAEGKIALGNVQLKLEKLLHLRDESPPDKE